jgi:3-oxoacyl-[acyl-carrier protein] reductase
MTSNKTWLITGAGRGMGVDIAKAALAAGHNVVASGRNTDTVTEAVGEADDLLVVKLDVTRRQDAEAAVQAAVDRFGGIDVLVNNAGLGGTARLVDMTDEQWSVVLDVTLNGTFRCTRAALRHMGERGRGVIVNNASVLGWRAQAGQAHYAAAKAGVMALTRCAALEGADAGVRVNAVAPSLAMHPFLNRAISDDELAELTTREAFGRAAEPWEVATVIAFLASDYSTYMTGEVVSVSSQHP